jgi:3-methyl-2-oxobutanoate hydroxymethyltransferase
VSKTLPIKSVTPPAIQARKGGQPIVCLTSYTAPMARLVDPHADLILVGDSLAMTVYGMTSTVGVTQEMMIAHGRAVAHAASHACVVVDLPFGSYEGGAVMAETIHFLTTRGVPVMAHIGLTPQAVNALGGYGVRGRTEIEAAAIMADAVAVAGAGAFSVVIEKTTETLARAITKRITPPTIGIGASVSCDG